MPNKAHGGLTPRQRKFAEMYAGNGTQAAREAGYHGDDNTLAQTARELLRNPQVAKVVRDREAKEIRPHVATRHERQEFWTKVMQGLDGEADLRDRLKASELLGKSEADFVDRLKHEGDVTIRVVNPYAEAAPAPAPLAPPLVSPPVDPVEADIEAEEDELEHEEEHIDDPEGDA